MHVSENLPPELEHAPVWAVEVYQQLPPLVSYEVLAPYAYVTPKSLANIYSQGKGPKGGRLMGKVKVFPRLEATLWLMKKCGECAEAMPAM